MYLCNTPENEKTFRNSVRYVRMNHFKAKLVPLSKEVALKEPAMAIYLKVFRWEKRQDGECNIRNFKSVLFGLNSDIYTSIMKSTFFPTDFEFGIEWILVEYVPFPIFLPYCYALITLQVHIITYIKEKLSTTINILEAMSEKSKEWAEFEIYCSLLFTHLFQFNT